jgi:dihydroxyacetone kinase
MTRSHQRE